MVNSAAAPLRDGGMVWWYGKTVTIGGNRSDSLLVFRTDAAGRVIWNRTIDESRAGYAYNWYGAGFLQMLEMRNGNLLFSADVGSTPTYNGPMPNFTLLMLDNGGNRLWQNDYFGYANGALAEGLNGEILSWSAGRLTRFDANGNVSMQTQYQAGAGFSTTEPAIACTGNRIYLEGLYKQTTSYGWGNERGFYLIKTDYATGNVLDSRQYRLNPTDPSADTTDPGRSNFTVVHQGAGFAFATNIFSPSNSQFEVLLLSIDTMLNIVRPGLDLIKPVYTRLTGAVVLAADCGTNDSGVTACTFDDLLDRHLSYYAEVDEQGNFLAQRLLQFANPQYELSVFPGSGNVLQQAMVSSQDQVIPYFLYANNSPDLIGGPGCGGIDTSFITMRHIMPAAAAISFTPNALSSLTQSPVNTLSSTTVIDAAPVCVQKSSCDSININGPDTVCIGDTGVRFTVTKNPDCLRYTTWSMDTSLVRVQSRPDDTTLILAFPKSGRPWLSASPRGCGAEDSLQLTIRTLRDVNLGRDSTLCPGDSLILDAGSGYLTYVWQDASTDSVYTVDKAGTYIVRAVDQCDHPSADTVMIGYVDKTLSAGPDLTLCVKEDGLLTASSGFNFYTWQPSEAIAGDTAGQSVTIRPAATMSFIVTAFDKGSCPLRDTVLVTVTNCLNRLLVPGAFTPNDDGRNDWMRPIAIGDLVRYEFTIYNRWGQIVFRSSDPDAGWDGRIQGHIQEPGTFVWTCRYQFAGEEPTSAKGTFLLVR
ncbi:MAG TPA: gliding motility-associated C-terminal domain-containing protein [Puia sp.]|jgi:gliding motility-associated-like protein|nr:gliding motility-associated C-terminal domain-containing protein [Puia sp.]